MTYRSLLLITLSLIIFSGSAQCGILNTGFLVSQANQEADLTLEEVPRNITSPSEMLEISWNPEVPGELRYSSSFMGPEPQRYQNVIEDPEEEGDGYVVIEGRQLPVGLQYCIIDGGDEGYSAVFRVIRDAENAPEMVAPITAAGRQGINTVTPTFRWQPVEGVPFYYIIVSDQPFEINEDENGETKVEGANIVWQAITSQTSIMYGVPDPSEFFDSDNIPPLVGNTDRQDRPRYAWVVLSNYGNHPAYTSTITGGVSGFEVEVQPPFGEPENLVPEQASLNAEDEVLFRWTEVNEATSYFVYVSREEITPGGSQALLPAWSAQTNLTSIGCPAGDIFQDGRYIWKVLAANQQGRGTISDTTSFSYSLESGFVVFNSFTDENNRLQYVEIRIEPIDGAALLPFSTDDNGYHQHNIPVGSYRFIGTKNGYEDAVSDVIEIENEEDYNVRLNLRLLPSSIVGTVVDEENASVSGASVTANNVRTGDEVVTETNIAGEYQLDVNPGNWNISAIAAGHEPSEEIAIAVEEGHDYDFDAEHHPLVLQSYSFTVSGYVRNPAGQPIQLTEVMIESSDGDVYSTHTPQAGTYSFTVGVGDWTMMARKPGFYLESGAVPISIVNRDLEVNFTLVPQAGILSGQVLVNNSPSNGDAEVWFIPGAGDIITTMSNQIGGYSQGLAPGDYIVTPVQEGYSTEDRLEVSIGPGETISGVRLALWANPSSISGRITDSDNTPLQDASVTAAGVSSATDAQGNYRLDVAAGDHLVTARKQGYVTEEAGPVTVEAGQDVQGVNLRLVDNAGTISGRVRRGNEPLIEAVVTAVRQENNQSFTTQTDRQGNYNFGLRYGTYRLTVQRSGFVAAPPGVIEVQLRPGDVVSGRDFPMLNYSARIAGTVRSAAGPVNSPTIRITQLDDPNRVYNTNGNVEGRFALSVTPEKRYIVTATRNGYSTDADTTDQLEIEGEVSFAFMLNALPCQIRGRVSVGGAPLAAATVRAASNNRTYEVRTDGSGNYLIGLESGQYRISASKPGYTQSEINVQLNPGQNLQGRNLALEENFATIAGSTIDPDDEPITEASVILTNISSNTRATQSTDEDGAFAFERLVPGNYRLQSTHPRYSSAQINIGAVVGGQELRWQIMVMEPLDSRIEGTVVAGETPVANATVYARLNGDEISVRSNEQGGFVFTHVGQGVYTMLAGRVGYSGEDLADVEVTPGDTVAVELTMVRNDGQITGSVRDLDNVGLRGARVTAFDDQGHFAAVESTPAGTFTLDNLYPLSEYSVSVQLNEYSAEEDTIRQVENGDEVNFRLIPNALRMSGMTVNQANTPIGETSIQATSLVDGSVFRATSGDNGNYTLRRLAANTQYRIQSFRFEEIYNNIDRVVQTGANHMEGNNAVNLTIIERSGAISGNVGVRNVNMVVRNLTTGRITSIYSDANGRYRLSRLRDGNFVVKAQKAGYRVSPDSIVVNGVGIGEEREDVNFSVVEIRVDISGSVIDGDGVAFAGVPVLAWSQNGEYTDTTVEDGSFDFTALFPNNTYQVTTVLPQAGYDNSSREIVAQLENISGVQLQVVRHNASIAGVVSSDGEALMDVRVLLDGIREMITGADGRYLFESLSGGDHQLTYVKSGYLSSEATVNTGNGENQGDVPYTQNIGMEPLRSALYGLVKRSDTELPLVDCVVYMEDSEGNSDTRLTGNDGGYNFNNLNTNLTYMISVSKKGFGEEVRENLSVSDVPTPVRDILLTLNPSSISGCFRDQNGLKITNARVYLRSFDNTVDYDTTDHAGDFTFQAESGNYMLLAEHPQPALGTSFNLNIPLGQGATVYTDLVLTNTGVIRGILQTEAGNPPASSGYIVSRHGATGIMVFNWSDAAGGFLLRGLRSGMNHITVEAAGYAMLNGTVNVDVGTADTTRVTVVLTQSGKAITGNIADQYGDPVVRARVAIAGPTSGNFLTTDEGYYSLSGPDAGDYLISVERAGYASPVDTTFTLNAGDIVQVNREMNLIANAVSGRVLSEFGNPVEDVKVFLYSNGEAIDSVSTNSFGEYQFENLAAGDYIVAPIKEFYDAEPMQSVFNIEDGESLLNRDFKLILVRGYGNVNGLVMHGGEPVIGADIVLRDLDTGQRYRTVADTAGRFIFNRTIAPATYRLRAIYEGREELDSSFTLLMDSTVYREIQFPTGQIRVRLLDSGGLAIFNRPISITGVNIEFALTIYSEGDGNAETNDWLKAGTYSVVPSTAPGELAAAPRIVELQRNQQVDLQWHLGWKIKPPPPFSFADSARVEINIPQAFSVTEGLLYWKGPGAVIWSSRPLQQELQLLASNSRNIRSVTPELPNRDGSDEADIYYAYIPPQNRSGALLYYFEVQTGEGFTFGGPSTVQEVQITNQGLLDHLDLKRSMSAFESLQIGVPIELQVTAYDDADSNLTVSLGQGAFTWTDLDTSRGELIPNPDDATRVIYLPTITGPVRVGVTVSQTNAGVTVRDEMNWVNNNRQLDQLIIGPLNLEIASGDSGLLNVSALDVVGASMPVLPVWEVENEDIGYLSPKAYSLEAWFHSLPGTIGRVRLAVTDSLTGLTTYFNEEEAPDEASRGLPVYGLIKVNLTDVQRFTDSAGFEVLIPPGAVNRSGPKLYLEKPELPAVMRVTPQYQSSEIGYDLRVEGSINAGVDYILRLPVPDDFSGSEPLIGVWDATTVQWNVMEGSFTSNRSAIELVTHELGGLYAFISTSGPLKIGEMKFSPNPFSPEADGLSIEFKLESDQADYLFITLKIYNMSGELVRSLIDGEQRPKGVYSRDAADQLLRVIWDGKTDSGRMARNGRYVVVLKAVDASGEAEVIGTAVLIK